MTNLRIGTRCQKRGGYVKYNYTSSERARILHLLCEGMSIRAITRTTGAEHLWEIGDIVALIEKAKARIPRARGPYKKRA